MDERTCRKCGVTKPFTREFFSPRRWTCNACMRATTNKWDQDNPGKKAISRSAYKQRAIYAGGGHTPDELLLLRLKQERKCYYCEADFGDTAVEKDHRTPLSKGGTNDASNVVYACRTCNRDKGSKLASDFFAWRRSEGLHCRPPLTCFFCESDLADAGNVSLRMPVQRGGAYLPENLVWACPSCHTEKNDQTAAEYLSWRRQNGLKTRQSIRVLVKRTTPK